MNLQTVVNTLKSGGGITNPITAVVALLTPKAATLQASSDPSISVMGADIQAMITSSNTVVNASVNSLMTNLPLMNAVNDILNKINTTTGQTTDFQNAFAPLISVAPLLNTINTSLSPAFMIAMAGYNSTSPPVGADATSVASITSQATSSKTTIDGYGSAATAALADGFSTLKAFGFANFGTGTKPPYVEAIFTAVVTARVGP